MKKTNLDIFKIIIILLLIYFLYLFYDFSKIGKYQVHNTPNGRIIIIDTRTGEISDEIYDKIKIKRY